jgi:hypothetical protein
VVHYDIYVEWDAEAEVWYIDNSNVPGLVGEAENLETMMTLLRSRVPEMLAENACPTDDDIPIRLLTTSRLADLSRAA